jgi:glycosyltransferase involved in cell wall biosynthesis
MVDPTPIHVTAAQPNGKSPLLSVVVPVYNGMPYLIDTLESVRRQTYAHWELIVCDHQSRDESAAAVRSYLQDKPDPRIRLVVQEKSGSMAGDWNHSLTHAQGEWIKLLPQDDLLLPDCLETQERLTREHPGVGFVTCGKEVIDAAGRRLFRRTPLRAGVYDWERLGRRSIFAVSNRLGEPAAILFRRDLLKTCGAYDDRLRYFIDLELLWRFLKVAPVAVWAKPLYQFRLHGQSVSFTSRRRALEEYAQILDRYADELGLADRPWLRRWLKLKSAAVVTGRSLIFQFLPGLG